MLSCSNAAAVPSFLQPRIHLLWYLVHWCAVAAREVVCGLLQQAGAAAEAIGPWCDVCIGGSTVEELRGLTDAQWEYMLTAAPPTKPCAGATLQSG